MSTVYRGLTAAGSTQSDALALASGGTYYEVATVDAGTGVQLPASSGAAVTTVKNADVDSTSLKIYPQTGGTVAGGATNAADTLAAGSSVSYVTANGTDWKTVAYGLAVVGGLHKPLTISTTATLTAAQSGTVCFVNAGSAYTITLPAVQAGLNYTLIQSSAASSGVTVAAAGAIVSGHLMGLSTGASVNAVTNVLFASGVSLKGDKLVYECDGTSWYVHGVSRATAGFTTS